MIKTLSVGSRSSVLGPDQVIAAMFTTISCRLEPQGWGTRFPAVMGDLYSGYVKPGRAPEVLRELREIETAARGIPASQVVWSLDGTQNGDGHDRPVNRRATNVFEYFVDSEGLPLICRLREGVQESLDHGQVLRLASPGEVLRGLVFGLVMALIGGAWMWIGRAFFPNWMLVKAYSDNSGIPIWTFGMDFVMIGAAIGIAMPFPALRDWFRRQVWAMITLAITAIIGWLIICARAGFIPD